MSESSMPVPARPVLENLVSRRTFKHEGQEVEEIIFQKNKQTRPCTYTLIWCKAPFQNMVVNGVQNPLVHVDFEYVGESILTSSESMEARDQVRASFHQHPCMQ